jgi:xylose isomerase
MEFPFESREFTYILYGGQKEYEKFLNIKKIKEQNQILRFKPETYAYEANEHLAEEGKILMELIKLHKSKALDVNDSLPYISDLTHYSRSVEIHFNIFKNIALAFASQSKADTLKKLIDELSIVGSVLMQEFNFDTNVVTDQIDVKFCFSQNVF